LAIANPLVITINAIANSLPKTSFGTNTGSYTKDDGLVSVEIAHQYGTRSRRRIRLNHSKLTPDPFIPTNNVVVGMSCTLSIDTPKAGYTLTEQKQVLDGFIAALSASSGALETAILGGES
jgi:hypothetical protein